MTHSAARTRAGARRMTLPVSRASSRTRAAFVLSFSFVAMVPSPFPNQACPPSLSDSITQYLEKCGRNAARREKGGEGNETAGAVSQRVKKVATATFLRGMPRKVDLDS